MKKYLLPVLIIVTLCLLLGLGFTAMALRLSEAQQAGIKAQQSLLLENLRSPVHNTLHAARVAAEALGISALAREVLTGPSLPAEAQPVQRLWALQKMASLFPFVEFIAVLDKDQQVRLASHPMPPGTKIVDSVSVEHSLRGSREFSPPYPLALTGATVIAATAPIATEEAIVGVAVAVINMKKLADLTTNSVELGSTGYISLADDRGNIIIHPDGSLVGQNISASPLGPQIMNDDSGALYGELYSEGQWVAFTTLPRTDWKLMLSVPYAEYMRPTTDLRNTTLLAGVGMTLLVLLTVTWMTIMLIRKMEKARMAAVESVRTKNDFLANMSHEIRTPMNGIIGLALLMEKTPLTPQQADYLAKIQFSSSSLLHLISDILDISKIEAQKLHIECLYFRLSDVLEHVRISLHTQAGRQGLFMEFVTQRSVPPILCTDPFRLSQILINLVGNGIKFTRHGGVRVAVEAQPRSAPGAAHSPSHNYTITFTVTDTGIGVQPDAIQHLFQPFTQADSSTTRKYGGTGLGLVICKKLAHLLGGDISMTSVYGEGSTFRVTIACEGLFAEKDIAPSHSLANHLFDRSALYNPGRYAALPIASSPTVRKSQAKKFPHFAKGFPPSPSSTASPFTPPVTPATPATSPTSATRATPPTRVEATGPKPSPPEPRPAASPAHYSVLLVEDNEINQQVAAELLTSMGVEVTLADTGLAAVNITRERHFDLILMDIQMPEMDGLTATAHLRARGLTTPIVAMTAHAMAGDHAKSLAAGMNAHITKPINPQTLQDTLHTYCPALRPKAAVPTSPMVNNTATATDREETPHAV